MFRKKWPYFVGALLLVLIVGTVFSLRQTNYAPSLTNRTVNDGGPGKQGKSSSTVPDGQGANDPNYVDSDRLSSVGQYMITDSGVKSTLLAQSTDANMLETARMSYQITKVQVLEHEATTEEALQAAKMTYNDQTLTENTPFYTVQITYVLHNTGKTTLTTSGISEVKFDDGATITALNGLSNSLKFGDTGLMANGKKTTTARVRIDDKAVKNLKKIVIKFASVNKVTDDSRVSGVSKAVTVSLE